MTMDDFADWVNGFSGKRPEHMRLGQWAFVLLSEAYPEIAQDITGRDDIDAFPVTARLPSMMAYILKTYVVAKDTDCV